MAREQKFAEWFHKLLINFWMWVCAGVLLWVAGYNLLDATGNHIDWWIPLSILQVIQIGSAALLIKARFDLARWKRKALKEILIAALMSAAIFLIDFLVHDANGDLKENTVLFALLAACWGIGVYRYYRTFAEDRLTD